jgi:hypothetical protein
VGWFRKKPRDPARHKVERYEGWWEATPTSPFPQVRGKIEWDAFASGDSEIELSVHVADLPDGADVVVAWGDVDIMTVRARRGVLSRDLETKDGDDVPRLADQHLELRYEGIVMARTHLVPD